MNEQGNSKCLATKTDQTLFSDQLYIFPFEDPACLTVFNKICRQTFDHTF